ncbi:pantothenate kinase [Leptotrichia sp.]|uniref:pantothenate kinase n=1 Tax=Leptotrichia sp. TaxID=104608 RepID=UPI0017BCB7A6|nr:pantothenate kinase [Leptotrichia sp.]MBB1535650.1 pantothenate kinase [Leptotrichia sp.]
MKKNLKKLCLLMVVLAMGVVTYANGRATAQNNTQAVTQSEEFLGGLAKGIDQKFTTDGKLHAEKFLNKTLSYTDTADTFKIQKDSKGYFVTKYIDESLEQDSSDSIKEEKVRLRLEKKVFLREVAKDGDYAYAYDTKLKKVVIINPHNNYRIMTVVD